MTCFFPKVRDKQSTVKAINCALSNCIEMDYLLSALIVVDSVSKTFSPLVSHLESRL